MISFLVCIYAMDHAVTVLDWCQDGREKGKTERKGDGFTMTWIIIGFHSLTGRPSAKEKRLF